MALITTIVIDQTASTATLTTTKLGNSVETITYTNSSKQVNFATRADINLTLIEFLDYLAQVTIFQTAILFNFNPNVLITVPFGSCNNTENHDSSLNKWNLVSIYGASPRVCNYSCDITSFTVDLVSRASPKTIGFPEWLYWLIQLDHYKKSIKSL